MHGGSLTSHLGSNLDPYYNQNCVITNDKEVQLYQDNISYGIRKPVYAMCEQKRHRSASFYAFHSQSNSPLLHVYMLYTPLHCTNAPMFSVRPRKKNMCVYYCMEKLNRVDRLENVFILLKKFVWG